MSLLHFERDDKKDQENRAKHGISFDAARQAFSDSRRVIAEDVEHSYREARFYCFGRVDDGILTVRFTYRENRIRIIGAGYWRKGKALYEKENQIHG